MLFIVIHATPHYMFFGGMLAPNAIDFLSCWNIGHRCASFDHAAIAKAKLDPVEASRGQKAVLLMSVL